MESRTPQIGLQRFPVRLAIVYVVYAIAFIGWSLVRPFGAEDLRYIAVNDIAGALPPLVAGLMAIMVGLRANERRVQSGWMLLGAGWLSWGMGEVIWAFYELILRQPNPFPSLADAGYLLMVPLTLAGILKLVPAWKSIGRVRTALDALAIGLSIFAIAWHFALRPIFVGAQEQGWFAQLLAGAYPASDVVLFLAVIFLIKRSGRGANGQTFIVFSAGLTAFLISDFGFTLQSLSGAYDSWVTVPTESGWVIGFLLMGYAAALQLHWRPGQVAQMSGLRVAPVLQQALPLIMILALIVVLAVTNIRSHNVSDDLVLVGLGVVSVSLVVARQMITLSEDVMLNRELERSRAFSAAVLAHTQDATIACDVNGTVTLLNAAARKLHGLGEEDEITQEWFESVALVRGDGQTQVNVADHPLSRALRQEMVREEALWIKPDGFAPSSILASARPLVDAQGQCMGAMAIFHDITRIRGLEQLAFQAFHDPLTNLPNRTFFADSIGAALASERSDVQPAVIFLDLDGFKTVNDSAGHAAGDKVIITVAQRLRAALSPSETLARLGGDEFAIMVENGKSARSVADTVLNTLQEPIEVEGRAVRILGSMGIALSTGNEEPDDLMRNAELAMYMAKGSGKGRYRMFEAGMHTAAMSRFQKESDLRQAIERREFVVYYQPEIDLNSGATVGMEALVRWQHPTQGLIAPAEFIPLTEELGLITHIGRFVREEACRTLRHLQQTYPSEPPLSLSVNLSPLELGDHGLVSDVARVIREHEIEPECLILEITESAFVSHEELVIDKLRELKVLGIRLAIDDFGTGYSSLSALQRFPVDILKIDKSFVDALRFDEPRSPVALAITNAIISLSDSAHLLTIAEGVEVLEQVGRLKDLGCEMAQGFYFGRPMDETAMEAYLIAGPGQVAEAA